MNNVKIKSDGNPQNTKVFTDEGSEIKGLTEIAFNITPNDLSVAKLTMENVQTDINAKAVFYITDPESGELKQVRSVQFADGTIWEDENA